MSSDPTSPPGSPTPFSPQHDGHNHSDNLDVGVGPTYADQPLDFAWNSEDVELEPASMVRTASFYLCVKIKLKFHRKLAKSSIIHS